MRSQILGTNGRTQVEVLDQGAETASQTREAVTVRTGQNFCHLEDDRGVVYYWRRPERDGPLPVPGDRVRVVRWDDPQRGRDARVLEAEYSEPDAHRARRALEADRLYLDGLVARDENALERAWQKLLEAFHTELAPARACLALVDVGIRLQKVTDARDILARTWERFRGAREVEREVAVFQDRLGQRREALELRLSLADVALDREMVKETVRLALGETVEADALDAQGVSLLTRVATIVRESRRLGIPIDDEPRAALIEALGGAEPIRRVAEMLLRTGFQLKGLLRWGNPAATLLRTLMTDAERLGLVACPGIDREILVLVPDALPAWKDLDRFRSRLREWRSQESSQRAHYALVVHPDTAGLEGVYRQGMAKADELLVPYDLAHIGSTGELERLKATLKEYLGRQDLFAVAGPVYGEGFFGREDEFRRLSQLVDSGHHVGVFGLRKMGKTSFLRQLAPVRARDLVVYVDLQTALTTRTMPFLWWLMARAVVSAFVQRYGEDQATGKFELGRRERFDALPRPEQNGTRFHQDVLRVLDAADALGSKSFQRLVLAIDEVEYLLPLGPQAIAEGATFFAWARGVSQETGGRVLTIVAGANPLVAERGELGGHDNPMFQLYREIYVPPLRRTECDEMVVSLGRRMGVEFTAEALDLIAVEAGAHPFVTRRLCSHVVKRFEHPREVSLDQVRDALQDFFVDSSPVFDEIVGRLGAQFPEEYALLELMVEEPLSAHELAELSGQPVDLALKHLLGYQLVAAGQDGRYRLKFKLLERWLARQSPRAEVGVRLGALG
jgi:hypothetical protein